MSEHLDLCSGCGKPAVWLLTGDDLGHRFTDVPYCEDCANETERGLGTEVERRVRA